MKRRLQIPRPLRTKARIDADVDAELQHHLAMRTAELAAAGMTPDDAAATARREFGDIEYTRRYCAEMDRRDDRSRQLGERLSQAVQTLGHATRSLRRARGYAAICLVTFA